LTKKTSYSGVEKEWVTTRGDALKRDPTKPEKKSGINLQTEKNLPSGSTVDRNNRAHTKIEIAKMVCMLLKKDTKAHRLRGVLFAN
jgi:hypothetical protein